MSNIKLTKKQRKWIWLGQSLRKGQNDITNQSIFKGIKIKSTWKRKLPNELKNEIGKLSVKPQQQGIRDRT